MTNRIAVAALALLALSSTQLFAEDFAILDSSVNTYNYSLAVNGVNCQGWNLGADSYKRDWTAWEYVLKNEQMSYRVIRDAEIAPAVLEGFKVLILANTFELDDDQMRVITEWVRKGGRLIATYGTGYQAEDRYVKGATNGLHQLWGDPSTKINSTYFLGTRDVKVQITRDSGPTEGFAPGSIVEYGALANVMTQRPVNSKDVNAFLVLNDVPSRMPAIIRNSYARGQVIYYAFSPEFFLALAYDTAGHCADDNRYGLNGSGGDPSPGLQTVDTPHWYEVNSAFVKTFYNLMKTGLNSMLE